ncbi:MAG: TIR domain-containing protein [Lachnospiraceae bacterium]|nr:TIR domain-containing protein [Lachnospiraceae bacterium]
MAKKVFISYSRKDTEWADKIKNTLEENHIDCWMDRAGIYAGGKYTREIIDAIKSCDIFLLVLSENAEQSEWVPKELGKAIQYHKYIIPVKISNFEIVEFELHLENIQILEVFGLSDSEANRLVSCTVKSILEQKSTGCGQPPSTIARPVKQETTYPESEDSPDGKAFRLWVSIDEAKPEEMLLRLQGLFTIGRSKECSLHFKDYHMSRQHFALEWDGKDIYIKDLGSMNGTYVNQIKLSEKQKLQPNDKIVAGSVKMIIRW